MRKREMSFATIWLCGFGPTCASILTDLLFHKPIDFHYIAGIWGCWFWFVLFSDKK